MVAEPSVEWLATAGGAAIKADVERAAASVRLLLQGVDVDPSRIERAMGQVLEICAETGPGALPAAEVRGLLYPALLHLQKTGTNELFGAHLRVIGRRADLRSSPSIDELLRDLAPGEEDEVPESSGEPDPRAGQPPEARELLGALERGEPPAVGGLRSRDLLTAVALGWVDIRGQIEPEVRATGDVFLLRSALLLRAHLPLGVAEAVANDETVWTTAAFEGLAAGLAEPLRADDLGTAQSALLNARLRVLRPRLFLRAPEALVIEPVGAKFDSAAIETALMDEVSAPLLRCLTTIEEENARSGERRPRKTVFRELATYVEQVLERLGSRVELHVGARTRFDPERHASGVPLEPGAEVRVVVPGLIDKSTRAVRIRALVEPVEEPPDEDESTDSEDSDRLQTVQVAPSTSERSTTSKQRRAQPGTGES